MNTSEQEHLLLEGLAKEDKSAIEQIYREHYNMVKSLVINNSGTADDAADIFQEAMIVLFEKAKSPEFELHCLLKTFIYSICRRLWLKRLQQQNRFVTQSEGLEETIPVEEELETHEKKQNDFSIMENAMSKIGEPCKSLLEAYYIQKKQMQEIATHFGYTNADNAKTQKYKCLVRLKKLFFAQYKNVE
ncbi:MAG: sigma-70 family polymerase sigma factor [Ferruginibacter sp.]|nr:sigma-70 family polymerase sigma factor [Ferruginibacter sp.]